MEPNKIIAAVARVYQISIKEMVSPSRKQNLVRARATCAAIIKSETELSLQQIATLIGKKDHATVIHCLMLHEDLLVKDRAYSHDFTEALEMARLGLIGMPARPNTKEFYCRVVITDCAFRPVIN
jgi:chromosomal replication initiation ATPase DnaA